MPVFEKTRPFMGSSEKGGYSLLGIPLDITTSYRPGTRFAPIAIREASYGLEEYDLLEGKDLREKAFFDRGDLQLPGSTEQALDEIGDAIEEILSSGSFPLVMGGEHLVTYPVVEVLVKKFKELHVVVLDAHADMRDEYIGLKFSHATAIRRVSEVVSHKRLFQFGIRSGSREEAEYYRSTGIYHNHSFPEDSFFDSLRDKDIYLSIDIDVLDPAHAPGTGTPEPCGWRPHEVILFIKKMRGIKLRGADLVEVSPPFDPSGITSVMAARIIKEILFSLT